MLKIVTVPNSILTQPTQLVKKIDKRIKKIVQEMEETLIAQKDPEGVGLAAPQVNIPLSLFIIKPKKEQPTKVFINPKILEKKFIKKTKKTSKKTRKLEGCLSIPKIWGVVNRPQKIYLQYQTLEGEIKKEWFSGFEAHIIDHEMDHLQGVLFTKKAIEQKKPLYQEKDDRLEKIEY